MQKFEAPLQEAGPSIDVERLKSGIARNFERVVGIRERFYAALDRVTLVASDVEGQRGG